MGDTWGDRPPPDAAYSRVSRNLGAVTAGFSDYLDELGTRLGETYDCVVRAAYDDELTRLRTVGPVSDNSFVIAPATGGGAALLVGRSSYDGGATAIVSMGRAVDEEIPDCFCDACDEDSDSLIDQLADLVQVAVRGFHEFRRPHVADAGDSLFNGPWLEQGYESGDDMSTRAGHDVRGEIFSVDWPAWPRRTP